MYLKKQKKVAASLSIFSNTLIILMKFVAGFVSGSISIISEAVHSVSDFLASVLTFFAVSKSTDPADKSHPFGHGKFEDMSGFIEGGLIIFAGIYIVYEAFKKLYSGYSMNTESMLGIYVMLFAVVANFSVSTYLFHIAKKTDSVSLYADAEHLRTDIFSSLGVLLGLILIKVTGIVILDPVIAIVVAGIIIRAGYSISKDTLNNLLDGSLPIEDIDRITQILDNNSSIRGYKDLRARKSGPYKEIEITIFFDDDLRIYDCHLICDEIENGIKQCYQQVSVIIHSEPASKLEINHISH